MIRVTVSTNKSRPAGTVFLNMIYYHYSFGDLDNTSPKSKRKESPPKEIIEQLSQLLPGGVVIIESTLAGVMYSLHDIELSGEALDKFVSFTKDLESIQAEMTVALGPFNDIKIIKSSEKRPPQHFVTVLNKAFLFNIHHLIIGTAEHKNNYISLSDPPTRIFLIDDADLMLITINSLSEYLGKAFFKCSGEIETEFPQSETMKYLLSRCAPN